ncbi:MAG: GTPase HflX [Alphaproteobacteria bacterium]|nr:GTPase HflX [Alphaproteobacteria bacterium]
MSSQTALVIHPILSDDFRKNSPGLARGTDARIAEIESLTRAIDLAIVATHSFKVPKIMPGAFLGKGQRALVAEAVKDLDPEVVVFNHALSPVQQRNLEKEWGVKVIDRTGLILEIFGARAQTAEGRLQVELAALDYQRSRLVRSWTHLERQRGGAGFMGGPGETQIELDRRMIAERMIRLKKDLEKVRKTRELGRKSRARIPLPVIALVGYTNAGKSTLFNTLTDAGVFAQDLLFATLDPKMRRIEMPSGQGAILSDTVGFISELPTHLIESFKATLENVTEADIIAHVIDISNPDGQAQREDVIGILSDLGINYEEDGRIIEIFNKIDAFPPEEALALAQRCRSSQIRSVAVSALSGQGIQEFLKICAEILSQGHVTKSFRIDQKDGAAISWLYEHGEVLNRVDGEEEVVLRVRLDSAQVDIFGKRYGYTD